MTKQKLLYTYILAHYNQFRYIFTALDSVIRQDYPEIEIIVIDDGSSDFSKDEVLDYLNRNKKNNIKSIQVLVNEENVGTVRSLNKALRAASGEYIQVFAADDCLFDDSVASRFSDEFEKLGGEAQVLCAHAMYMDEDMNTTEEYFCPPRIHEKFNGMDAIGQFVQLSKKCWFAMGAVCVRAELYKRIGYFSENYKYVEDWPFFLAVTRSGVKINTVAFKALEHRAGGISTTVLDPTAPLAIMCLKDVLNAVETEILPYLKIFPIRAQNDVIDKYYKEYKTLLRIGGQRRKIRWYNFCKYSYKAVARRFLIGWRNRIKKFSKNSLRLIYMSALILFVTIWVQNGSSTDASNGFPWAGAITEIGYWLSSAVLICAIVFLALNIILWVANRVYRMAKR